MMTKIKYIGLLFVVICAAMLYVSSLCYAANLQDDVDPEIQSMIIKYLESTSKLPPEEKAFVYCDFLGMSTKGNRIVVYAWCVPWTYILKDNQVLEGSGSSVPTVIYLEKTKSGLKVNDHKEPDDATGYEPRHLFPKQYRGHLYRPDKIAIQAKKTQKQIIDFYSAMLHKDRFIDKPKPINLNDPHNHQEPIYSYLNQKDSYQRVSIVLQTDMAKVVTSGGGDPIRSPDGKFNAWIGVGQQEHLYFKNNIAGGVYEIVNLTKDQVGHIAWKGDHILVFDQENGVDRFNPRHDRKEVDWHHGVHFEIDVNKREILWAVPFGELGFPKMK